MKAPLAFLTVGCTIALFTSCGGHTASAPTNNPPTATPNPTPQIAAISPNNSDQGGPQFTLSVVGSSFISNSTVYWNGNAIAPTTVLSGSLLTIDLPATAVATPGPDIVTVVNPPPGGGTSNSFSFSVPCPIAAPSTASNQTHARLGAYYFDGWSSPLTNFHFQGLPLGPYQSREPLSAWQDFGSCAVEEQLAWAHNSGIDFFVFDWYFNT